MTAQEWLDTGREFHFESEGVDAAEEIIRDLLAKTRLNSEWEEKYNKEHERLGYALQDARITEKKLHDALRQLEAAEACAAQHLADQDLLVAQERKRVARECAEMVEKLYGTPPFMSGIQIGNAIRAKYGADTDKE